MTSIKELKNYLKENNFHNFNKLKKTELEKLVNDHKKTNLIPEKYMKTILENKYIFYSLNELDDFIKTYSKHIKELYLYEYYQEFNIHLNIKNKDVNVKLIDEEDDFLREVDPPEYISEKFKLLKNLKSLSYTTRFPSETNMRFKNKPKSLTDLTLENDQGLKVKFLEGIKTLTFYNFPYEFLKKHKFPKSIKKIIIETSSIEFNNEIEFKKIMEKLNLVKKVEIETDEIYANDEEIDIEKVKNFKNITIKFS